MPREIHPMLATSVESVFDSNDWLYEIKWDGYRSVIFFGEDGNRSVRMVSRNQNEQTNEFPELQVIADQLDCETCIIDGEIVALDENGRASFSMMREPAARCSATCVASRRHTLGQGYRPNGQTRRRARSAAR